MTHPTTAIATPHPDAARAAQLALQQGGNAIDAAIAVAATYRALDTLRVLEGPLVADQPGATIRTVPLLVWDTTFSSFELGLGAAMSVLLLVLAALVAVVLVPLLRVRRAV